MWSMLMIQLRITRFVPKAAASQEYSSSLNKYTYIKHEFFIVCF